MSTQTSDQSNDLQAILSQAVQAYELARATRLQVERQAQDELRQRLDALQKQQETQVQQVEAEYTRDHAVAVAEQRRLSDILAATEQVRIAAGSFLEKAGLAHIAGVPLRLDETGTTGQRQNEALAKEFAVAQLAYVDMRTALLQLAMAYTDVEQWEQARQVIQPLLDNKKAPLYSEAAQALCVTHYRPGMAAFATEDWVTALQCFEAVLRIDPGYRDTSVLVRKTGLQHVKHILEAGNFEEARGHAEIWLVVYKNDAQFTEILRETYLRPARQTLQSNGSDEERLYKVSADVEVWFKVHKDDAEAHSLLCEIHYILTVRHIKQQQWREASEQLKILHSLNPAYRDMPQWLASYPFLMWLGGEAEVAQELKSSFGHALNFSSNEYLLTHDSFIEVVSVWEVTTGKLVHSLALGRTMRGCTAFSPDGRWLAVGSEDRNGGVKMWEVATGHLIRALEGKGYVASVTFSPDGRWLAAGSLDGQASHYYERFEGRVELWELATGRLVSTLNVHEGQLIVTFSPEGQWLAVGGEDKVNLWQITTGKLVSSLKHSSLDSIAFSPDGRSLAGGDYNEVRLWNITTGELLSTLKSEQSMVYSVAFSPDGYLLACGGYDGTVQLWEISTGRRIQTLRVYKDKDSVTSLAFSPDGLQLASGGSGNTKIWKPKV